MIRIFDADGNDISQPPRDVSELEPICEVGGEFDETTATLSVYSKDLEKDEVTTLLGIQPTKAWNPGERHPLGNGKSGKTREVDWGKWLLTSERDQDSVESKIRGLLAQCTSDLEAWTVLAAKYEIWLTIGGFLKNWNRELFLASDILKMLAERHLQLNVDVYFDGDGSEESDV